MRFKMHALLDFTDSLPQEEGLYVRLRDGVCEFILTYQAHIDAPLMMRPLIGFDDGPKRVEKTFDDDWLWSGPLKELRMVAASDR